MTRAARETDEVADGILRLVRALGRRTAAESPEELRHLMAVQAELAKAFETAVHGLRAQGFTYQHLGDVLGVTRQAVEQRWHDA